MSRENQSLKSVFFRGVCYQYCVSVSEGTLSYLYNWQSKTHIKRNVEFTGLAGEDKIERSQGHENGSKHIAVGGHSNGVVPPLA